MEKKLFLQLGKELKEKYDKEYKENEYPEHISFCLEEKDISK